MVHQLLALMRPVGKAIRFAWGVLGQMLRVIWSYLSLILLYGALIAILFLAWFLDPLLPIVAWGLIVLGVAVVVRIAAKRHLRKEAEPETA